MNSAFEELQPCRASYSQGGRRLSLLTPRLAETVTARGLRRGRSHGGQAGWQAPCQRQRLCPHHGELRPSCRGGHRGPPPLTLRRHRPALPGHLLESKGLCRRKASWLLFISASPARSLSGPKYQLGRRAEEAAMA